MAAEYDFREKPNPKGEQEELLYPRVVTKGTIKANALIQRMKRSTSIDPNEIFAVIGLLSDTIAEYINEGYIVEVGGLGYFSPSLATRIVKDKKEIRSTSIKMSTVNFQASKSFKKKLKSDFVKSKTGFSKSKEITLEKRKALLDAYLSEHNFISRKEYSNITGLLKDKALRDLNKWVEEGYLKTYGKVSTKIFLKSDPTSE